MEYDINLIRKFNLLLTAHINSRELIINSLTQVVLNEDVSPMRRHIIKSLPQATSDRADGWSSSYYFPKIKLIYTPIPKNATNSIIMSLLRIEDPALYRALLALYRHDALFALSCIQNIARLFQVHNLSLYLDDDIKKVCFVRDPVSRFISALSNKFIYPILLENERVVLEPFVSNFLEKYNISRSEVSVRTIIDGIKMEAANSLDGHFQRQIYFSVDDEKFKYVKLSNVKNYLDKLLGMHSNYKILNMNRDEYLGMLVLESNDINKVSGLDELINLPIKSWSSNHLKIWMSGDVKKSKNILVDFVVDFYASDFLLFQNSV